MNREREYSIALETGTNLYCRVRGHGAPALLLHGVPDSADLWGNTSAALAPHFRCYVPDLPGFARSDAWAGQQFSLDGHVALIDTIIETMDIPTPLTLVAHDWGGIMAMAWAARHPTKVKQLVVASAPFHASYDWHAWAKRLQSPLGAVVAWALGPGPGQAQMRKELQRGSQKLTTAQRSGMLAVANKRVTRNTILKLYRSWDAERMKSWNARLCEAARAFPFSVLWGEHEPYIPYAQAELLGAGDVTLVPGVGHWVPSEAPEVMARAVLRHAKI